MTDIIITEFYEDPPKDLIVVLGQARAWSTHQFFFFLSRQERLLSNNTCKDYRIFINNLCCMVGYSNYILFEVDLKTFREIKPP